MTTQTHTVHNPGSNTYALRFAEPGGGTPIYCLPGKWQDVPLTIADGTLMMTLVATTVVPQGGGGRNEE